MKWRGLNTFKFISLAVALMMGLSAYAESCEPYLLNEFNRRPNDYQNGLVSDRIPLDSESLTEAYKKGIFPWGSADGQYVRWHRPPLRGILQFDELHIGRSDRKYLKKALSDPELTVTFDKDFRQVVEQCATVPRYMARASGSIKVPDSTWITPNFINAYDDLHKMGLAHSVEVWRGDKLVGGLYGTFIKGVFVGESMFHLEPDVTKLAFYALIERLKESGHTFMDTQMAIGLAGKWGAKYIGRDIFERKLREVQKKDLLF